ncbi:MAG TPA: hypothetical protein VLC46_20035 [Thermoanaerobaculia bacterium]|jgi:hypothetical protein|nr:hypothetical protein [Thermoanaerobaculia bacterium]
MTTIFACLIVLQFIAVTTHDWIDIPGWTTGSRVQAVVGRRKLLVASLINAIFPGMAVALAIIYWNRPVPRLVPDYWILYCGVTVVSAIAMWYIPYFLGASEERKRDYGQMYAGTHHILPPRGDNLRPNLLHVCFHILFAVNLILAILIRFR